MGEFDDIIYAKCAERLKRLLLALFETQQQ